MTSIPKVGRREYSVSIALDRDYHCNEIFQSCRIVSFRKKLQFLLILLVGVSCGLLVWLSLRKANRLAFELIQEKVLSIAVSTPPRIDSGRLNSLKSREQDGSPDYVIVRDKLREVRDANRTGALPVRFIYIMRPVGNGEWEFVVDAEENGEDKSWLGDKVAFENESEKPDLANPRVDEVYSRDSFGTWLSGFAPIRDPGGEPVAVVGVDIAAERIQSLLRRLLIADLSAMIVALLLASALAAWLSAKITRPLVELRDFARRLGQGDLSSRLPVKGGDEFAELARAANLMAERLEERESLKGALVHYVRSQAADTKLSDPDSGVRVNRKVTVLVAELRGFEQLSSRLGSERVFSLLNEYFSTMIDIVLRHRGSLEKSSDKSVIAVFGSVGSERHQERKAVETALSMQHALARLLHEWEVKTDRPIVLDIGIHTGNALAAQDGQKQLEFDSVHRIVEQAIRVKSACSDQDCGLVVSEATARKLQSTFPLNSVDSETVDFPLFRVEMPKPTFK